MKRKSYRPYILFSLLLFSCMNLPLAMVESLRSSAVRLASPGWKQLSSKASPHQIDLEKLEAAYAEAMRENELLRARLHLEKQNSAITFARIVYREPATWSSTVWIDAGEEKVAQGSPVLSGNHLIGMVEKVEKKQSRVRLLTDSSLVVSVRVVRGDKQKVEMLRLVDELMLELSLQQEHFPDLIEKLRELKTKLLNKVGDRFLAKGELFGASSPLWRSRSSTLKGVGFNYDFADDKGPALELRTGKPYDALLDGSETFLIEEGDLLVTTGMDGIFPENIPVAIVSKVESLKEGAVSYSIEAKLCASHIEDLSTVAVLPPLLKEMIQ